MDIVFTPFTHEEMVAGIHTIADAATDWAPTLLVGVGRGGLTPAVFLSHRMGLSMVSIDHSTRIAQFGEELVAVLAQRTRDGDRLLFVEDINDSGKTIGEIRGPRRRRRGRRTDPFLGSARQHPLGAAGRLCLSRDRPQRDQGLVHLPLGSDGAARRQHRRRA
jgi:Phosphoribosyl transferase domain